MVWFPKRILAGFVVCCAALSSTAVAKKGGFAPSDIVGSRDHVEAFEYRKPTNKTSNIRGPVPSNRWWSGLLVRDEVQCVSPFPLHYGIARHEYPAQGDGFGIAVSFKGAGVVHPVDITIPDHVKQGWMIEAPVHSSFLVWSDALTRTQTKTRLHDFGDWHVVLQTADESGLAFSTTMTAGSPYSYFSFTRGNPRLRINGVASRTEFRAPDGNQVLAAPQGSYKGDHLLVRIVHPHTAEESVWGFFAAADTVWKRTNEYLTVELGNGAPYLVTALLPNAESLPLFYQHAYAKVVGTRADYAYNEANATITTTFSTSTQLLRPGFSRQAIGTLFPHQYRSLVPAFNPEEPLAYKTLRGVQRVFVGNKFQTRLRNHGILTHFNEPMTSPGYSHEDAVTWLGWEDYVKENYAVCSYGMGKTLHRAAQTVPIADQVGDFALRDEIIENLYNEFADWFTYSPGQERQFWADNAPYGFFSKFEPEDGHWGHLTAWRSSFGTQALNDLHLHFGYWIHAASILAMYHPTFVADYGWIVEELIRNLASPFRDDTSYPRLRMLDPYTGRSYASGYYWFGYHNGNDLESTSEALHAWQAIFQWGQITKQPVYRDLGLYLYWTEKSAVDQYWLDVDGDVFHPDYNYSIVSLLRESSYEFNTHWGSQQIEEHYGIQMLPLTPSTLHMGLNRPVIENLWNEMSSINRAATGENFDTWHGILLKFQALVDPQGAVDRFQFGEIAGPPGREYNPIQDHETWSIVYHFIHSLNALGHPSTAAYADQPSYGVFAKGPELTFVGFNPYKDRPLTIRFYDTFTGDLMYTMNDIAPLTTVTSASSVPPPPPNPDRQPPDVVTGLVASEVGQTHVALQWTEPYDNVAVQSYLVQQNGVSIASNLRAMKLVVDNLAPSTQYSFTVQAKDAAGNVSALSEPVLVTTQAKPQESQEFVFSGVDTSRDQLGEYAGKATFDGSTVTITCQSMPAGRNILIYPSTGGGFFMKRVDGQFQHRLTGIKPGQEISFHLVIQNPVQWRPTKTHRWKVPNSVPNQ